jgi:FtsZ-binding cell division protein ZapB
MGTEPYACGCGCGHSFRRFVSSQEEQESLESYSDQLKKELTAVEERIKELVGK